MTGPVDPKAPGRFSKALMGLFMKRARIAAVEDVADRFRLVSFEGDALQGIAWAPGQKVQIAMGSAFATRTYTPVDWDVTQGRTRILGYAHGDGPGSAWLSGLSIGDECDIFGPRRSLDIGPAASSFTAFGDETSIGLVHALTSTNRLETGRSCFEVNDVATSMRVLARLGLEGATLVSKRDDDSHIDDMETALGAPATAGASFILTGKASTIQRLRQKLKQLDVPAGRILTKAYWATGKSGLD